MTENLTINRHIEGDINQRTTARVPQKGVEEFLASLDAVLDVPGVIAVRWNQYTPYFNDGDPCEFSAYLRGVKLEDRFLTEDELANREDGYDVGDYEDGFVDSYELYQADRRYPYNDPRFRTFVRNGQDTTELYAALTAFEKGFPAFENVIQANFGDPAEVTATKEGFNVEDYDHD